MTFENDYQSINQIIRDTMTWSCFMNYFRYGGTGRGRSMGSNYWWSNNRGIKCYNIFMTIKADFHSVHFSERSILCNRFLLKCV